MPKLLSGIVVFVYVKTTLEVGWGGTKRTVGFNRFGKFKREKQV
jgi:hypothetical protein